VIIINREVYGYIYKIKNKINNKKYFGQTVLKTGIRWNGTLSNLKDCYKNNPHLINSALKYGVENFEAKTIDSAKTKEKLDELEEYYIIKFDTINRKKGYNMRYGGSRGKLSEETKKKISESHKGKYRGRKR